MRLMKKRFTITIFFSNQILLPHFHPTVRLLEAFGIQRICRPVLAMAGGRTDGRRRKWELRSASFSGKGRRVAKATGKMRVDESFVLALMASVCARRWWWWHRTSCPLFRSWDVVVCPSNRADDISKISTQNPLDTAATHAQCSRNFAANNRQSMSAPS